MTRYGSIPYLPQKTVILVRSLAVDGRISKVSPTGVLTGHTNLCLLKTFHEFQLLSAPAAMKRLSIWTLAGLMAVPFSTTFT